jgi:hypothetical protein
MQGIVDRLGGPEPSDRCSRELAEFDSCAVEGADTPSVVSRRYSISVKDRSAANPRN